MYTSGIVSSTEGHQIALFFTGTKHAGENLAAVLEQRAAELPPPIQMCDALSHNTAGEFDTIVANCIAHARRQFVDVAPRFPEPCRYVLETLREVYRNDALARAAQLSPAERLAYHQEHSGPPMRGLQWWLYEQIEQRQVEPNSTLGGAVNYMRKHWHKLTLFLQVPGAPLDNNVCERVLKKAITAPQESLCSSRPQNGAARRRPVHEPHPYRRARPRSIPSTTSTQLQRHATAIRAAPQGGCPGTIATRSPLRQRSRSARLSAAAGGAYGPPRAPGSRKFRLRTLAERTRLANAGCNPRP